jgi:hypothetical protein
MKFKSRRLPKMNIVADLEGRKILSSPNIYCQCCGDDIKVEGAYLVDSEVFCVNYDCKNQASRMQKREVEDKDKYLISQLLPMKWKEEIECNPLERSIL